MPMPYSVSPHWNLQNLQAVNIEAEIELLALHAARFGDEKMPQLVNENHEAQAAADLQYDRPMSGIQKP